MRNTLDRTDETSADRAAAHVAIFAALSCSELSSSAVVKEFAFEPDGIVGRDAVARRLAGLSKPVWLDATAQQGGLRLQTGPLSERPGLQRRYDVWHGNRTEGNKAYPPPDDDALILCCTEAHALRARWRDFIKYQRDYLLAGDFSYGMSDVGGKSPGLREFEAAELRGISRTIHIGRPGPILIFDDRAE